MGADGGVQIFKYKDVQTNWNEIQTELYVLFSTEFTLQHNWRTRENEMMKSYFFKPDVAEQISKYNIQDKTCKEFCTWLHTLCSSCKTPYALDDYILMSYGDNVWDEFKTFKECFESVDCEWVETWT
jgi:hypothetical protein